MILGGREHARIAAFCEREDKEGVLGNKSNNDSKHEPQVNDGACVCVNGIETIMDATINNNNGRLHKKSLEIKGTPHTHMYAFVNYKYRISRSLRHRIVYIYIYMDNVCVRSSFTCTMHKIRNNKKNQIIHHSDWIHLPHNLKLTYIYTLNAKSVN